MHTCEIDGERERGKHSLVRGLCGSAHSQQADSGPTDGASRARHYPPHRRDPRTVTHTLSLAHTHTRMQHTHACNTHTARSLSLSVLSARHLGARVCAADWRRAPVPLPLTGGVPLVHHQWQKSRSGSQAYSGGRKSGALGHPCQSGRAGLVPRPAAAACRALNAPHPRSACARIGLACARGALPRPVYSPAARPTSSFACYIHGLLGTAVLPLRASISSSTSYHTCSTPQRPTLSPMALRAPICAPAPTRVCVCVCLKSGRRHVQWPGRSCASADSCCPCRPGVRYNSISPGTQSSPEQRRVAPLLCPYTCVLVTGIQRLSLHLSLFLSLDGPLRRRGAGWAPC
jgi:hypothetical protein